ncbi:MAG: YfgM family protein [Methylococcales bacterium]
MEIYDTDDELDIVKKWFIENGRAALIGLIIGIACIVGWNGWQNYKNNRGKEAADFFQELLKISDKDQSDSLLNFAKRIQSDYAGSTYANYAGFFLAKLAVETGKFDEARKELERIVANSSDSSIKNIARLRLLRILLDQGKAQEALDLVNRAGVSINGKFEAAYDELKGDAHVALGQEREARSVYQRAVELGRKSTLLDLKISDLPVPEAPQAP